ncbi:MAG: hypothetical protein ACJAQ1_000961 [Flavobacterium sp.]|jgi:uncharacterized protein (DUF1015 family)
MALVKPFKAVKPHGDKIGLVSSKSYEAYTSAELGTKLAVNPYSFLHIISPDYKFDPKVSVEQRFKLVNNKYLEFKKNNVFIQDKTPHFYIYERIEATFTFCGIIAATSVEDYRNNVIKKHEGTLRKREQLFKEYLKITGFNAEPVLLTFKDDKTIAEIIATEKETATAYEFSSDDKNLHKLWLVSDENSIRKISDAFAKIPSLYIADGHHRSASSALLAQELSENNKSHTGEETYNFFMSYLIPESQLQIAAYNRFVKDLNGLSTAEFLMKLGKFFKVKNHRKGVCLPTKKHHFTMYLNNEFYTLTLKKESYNFTNALSRLDAEILYNTILNPILGITDLTNTDRIGFVHQQKNSASLKNTIDKGVYKVGFGLLATNIDEMKEIADANLKMPPKTTYIQPKLRSGLTLYEF